MLSEYIQVEWSVPDQIRAFSTTRIGGYSLSQYAGFNLAEHVGDNQESVNKNRSQLISDLELKQSPFWLEQIHSTKVIDARCFYQNNRSIVAQADASFTEQPNQVCVVMTADCLPILFCNKQGTWVAAAHAGWRGLADGIIQKTIDCYSGEPNDLVAWFGPAISQQHFEVGADVREIFIKTDPAFSSAFIACREKHDKYRCDLFAISRMILSEYGIDVYGGDRCTFSEPTQFYSYRRDGQTGRMASLIWINQ